MHTLTLPQIQRIVSLTSNYPSGDNSQPFRFTWDGKSLTIVYEEGRGQHRLNPKHLLSWLTLGFLVESLDIAASEGGFSVELGAPPKVRPSGAPADLAVQFKWSNRPRDEALAGLETRFTERRPFQEGQGSADEVTSTLHRQVSTSGSGLRFLSLPISQSLFNYILRSDGLVWRDEQASYDLVSWMRLSDDHPQAQIDGLHWRHLELDFLARTTLKLAQNRPKILKLLPALGVEWTARKILARQLNSALGLCLVTVNSPEPRALIDCGRMCLRAWIDLNLAGYGVQPLTISAFAPWALACGAWSPELPQDFADRFRGGHELLRDAFGVPKTEIPVWMFRTGVSPKGTLPFRTPRRPLSDLLTLVNPAG